MSAVGEIVDLGLLGGILNHRRAFGEGRRHHEILGGADRRQIEINLCAAQLLRRRLDVAMALLDRRAHRFEAFQMQIDRPRADGAAAGSRDPRAAKARQQRTQNQKRRAHGFHQIVGRLELADGVGAQTDLVRALAPALLVDLYPEAREQLEGGANVGEVRHDLIGTGLARQQRSDQNRQRGVLRAAHG